MYSNEDELVELYEANIRDRASEQDSRITTPDREMYNNDSELVEFYEANIRDCLSDQDSSVSYEKTNRHLMDMIYIESVPTICTLVKIINQREPHRLQRLGHFKSLLINYNHLFEQFQLAWTHKSQLFQELKKQKEIHTEFISIHVEHLLFERDKIRSFIRETTNFVQGNPPHDDHEVGIVLRDAYALYRNQIVSEYNNFLNDLDYFKAECTHVLDSY